jgi:glyoxylase I family protein
MRFPDGKRRKENTMNIKTSGVHHIGLRSGNLERSKHFYASVLGFPVVMEAPLFIFLVGSTVIAMRGPEVGTPPGDVFNPFRVGLDHIALSCEERGELDRVTLALSMAGIENTGVKFDTLMADRPYVAFKDPDRIAWELYLAK